MPPPKENIPNTGPIQKVCHTGKGGHTKKVKNVTWEEGV